jgi:hypothetical protein
LHRTSHGEAHKYSNSNNKKNNSNQEQQQQQTKDDTFTRINSYHQHLLFTVMNSTSCHERKLKQEAPKRGLPRQSSLRCLDRKTPSQRGIQRNISFSDKVEKKVVEKIPHDSFLDVFYLEDEIAEFRQQAFMEECGFDLAEFAE